MADKQYQIRQVYSKGLGLFARQKIQTNTVIESVPETELITYDIVEDFYEFVEVLYDRTICNKVLFSYFLASMEIIGTSHHPEYANVARYIHQLPRTLHGLILWSPSQLQKITNHMLVEKVISKQKAIKQSFQKIHAAVKQTWKFPEQKGEYRLFSNSLQCEDITDALVLKYYSILQSRGVFYISSKSKSDYAGALVPIIDKLNHSENPNCVVEVGSQCLIRSIRKIERDEEILVRYGTFNPDEFLEFYGFLPDFSSGQSPNSPYFREKITQFYNRKRITESGTRKIGIEQ